jgi:hypothetical protein
MISVGTKLKRQDELMSFFCPACNESHSINVATDGCGHQWSWNGSDSAPTFSPSILVTGMQTINDASGNWAGEWVRDADGKGVPQLCHSFVVDGRTQYLDDCKHALAGQTVDLPDWTKQ